jgi:hypothetical protein
VTDVVQITRRDNEKISYQGKVLEKHEDWCKAIIIVEDRKEIWDCHSDFWNIEYGVELHKL